MTVRRLLSDRIAVWLLPAMLAMVLFTGGSALAAVSEAGDSESPPCENGTVDPMPADHPALVADCEVLLAAKDVLRGTAALNWSADLALTSWTGVTVGGTPQRVTALQLNGLRLDGRLPATLGQLDGLTRLDLYNNRLTGSDPGRTGDADEAAPARAQQQPPDRTAAVDSRRDLVARRDLRRRQPALRRDSLLARRPSADWPDPERQQRLDRLPAGRTARLPAMTTSIRSTSAVAPRCRGRR